jgi:hypothetical protein
MSIAPAQLTAAAENEIKAALKSLLMIVEIAT